MSCIHLAQRLPLPHVSSRLHKSGRQGTAPNLELQKGLNVTLLSLSLLCLEKRCYVGGPPVYKSTTHQLVLNRFPCLFPCFRSI